jgi:hypothetical protein
MAADTATFQLNLQDNISGAAESASQALEGLRDSITKDTKALAQLQRAQKNLQQGSSVNIEQFRKLQAQISATKERIASAQSSAIDLGGTLEKGKRPTSGFAEALAQMQQQAQGVGGPLGSLVGRFGNLKGILGANKMALGILGIGIALAAFTVATIAAAKALLTYGIASQDARRSELLRLEGLTTLKSAHGFAAGSALEMQSALDQVSGSTALSREEVSKYASGLYRAGLRGEALTQALEATAITASVQGDEMAQAFLRTAAGANAAGGSIKRLADSVRNKLGGISARQMLSLGVISSKLKENFSLLFSGLNIEGFLSALKKVADLFSLNTASGKALKQILTVVFQPFIGGLESSAVAAKRFFQGIILGTQDIIIALLKTSIWIKETFGISFKNLGSEMGLALSAGRALALALAAGFALAGALATVLVASIGLIVGAVAVASTVWMGFGKLIKFQLSIVKGAYDWIAAIEWYKLGSSICQGVVKGIKSGAQWVIDSIKGLASQAMNAFKYSLGINSPSKVFANLGLQLPAGVEQGIRSGETSLNSTVSGMVAPPNTIASPTAPQVPTKSITSKPTISIGDITINTNSNDGKGIATDIKAALEDILSGLTVQLGVPT